MLLFPAFHNSQVSATLYIFSFAKRKKVVNSNLPCNLREGTFFLWGRGEEGLRNFVCFFFKDRKSVV